MGCGSEIGWSWGLVGYEEKGKGRKKMLFCGLVHYFKDIYQGALQSGSHAGSAYLSK